MQSSSSPRENNTKKELCLSHTGRTVLFLLPASSTIIQHLKNGGQEQRTAVTNIVVISQSNFPAEPKLTPLPRACSAADVAAGVVSLLFVIASLLRDGSVAVGGDVFGGGRGRAVVGRG